MQNGADEIYSYLDKYGTFNKDKNASRDQNSKKKRTVSSKRHPREILDLHGLRSDEAMIRLRMTVERCKNLGVKELLVIHGIGYHSKDGGPVLKQLVRQMLENELCLSVRDYRTALPRDGGDGATLIYLR